MKKIKLHNTALYPVHEQTIDLDAWPDLIFYRDIAYFRIGIQEGLASYREATVLHLEHAGEGK